jgi:hypothetical protein
MRNAGADGTFERVLHFGHQARHRRLDVVRHADKFRDEDKVILD